MNLPESRLLSVQRDLEPLKLFLERNFNVFQSGGSGYGHEFDASREAWQAELVSLRALQSLVTQAIEGIAYILLMIDYKISDVLAKLVTSRPQLTLGALLSCSALSPSFPISAC